MTIAPTTTDRELQVSIATPGDWLVLSAEKLADVGTVDELVGDRLDAIPELAQMRDALVRTVAGAMDQASRSGVFFTAVMSGLSASGDPMLANLAVAATALPDREAEEAPTGADAPTGPDGSNSTVPAHVADIARALATESGDERVAQRDVSSMLLPGGPAVRIARVTDLPLTEGGRTLMVLSVQYFFVVPGNEELIVMSFTTPSIAAHRELLATFHQIAATFEVH